MKKWYKLDAFAKTYSSIISEGRSTCFRLSAVLKENVEKMNKEDLEKELKDSYKKALRAWNSNEREETTPAIKANENQAVPSQ